MIEEEWGELGSFGTKLIRRTSWPRTLATGLPNRGRADIPVDWYHISECRGHILRLSAR